MTAFVAAGVLVFSILEDNGGSGQSQKEWQDANARAISLAHRVGEVRMKTALPQIDHTVTGSISEIDQDQGDSIEESGADEELSVLALIRKNSDVAPGVSSGTARVSITVKKGDTLFQISQKHGLSVAELARLNGLSEPFTIKVGQTIYVAR